MSSNANKPNVLMFITHDQGNHLGCYGHKTVKSPNLDRLANEGVRFTNHFAAAPECTPSRSGIYNGLYTHQTGLMGLCHRGWEYSPETEPLALKLWKGDYQTHLFGFQHETDGNPKRLGYNHIHSQMNFRSATVCDNVIDFLNSENQGEKEPWFASVGFYDVHRYKVGFSDNTDKSEKASFFKPEDIEVPPYLPDNLEVRRDLALFHQAIEDMDVAVGNVLKVLNESKLAENTIVVFTTDHGIPFPRAKSTFYDPGIQTALIMRWPKGFKGGCAYDQLISNLDYCPTILEACGIKITDGLEGRSFLPLLQDRMYKQRDEVAGALYYDALYDPMHYVRTSRYKYIKSFALTPEQTEGLDPEILAKHKTGTWIRADDSDVQRSTSWKSMKGPFPAPVPEELYDLQTDPLEQNNVVANSKYADVLTDLRNRMNAMMKRTNSPLLAGHVSPELSMTKNMPIHKWLEQRISKRQI